MRRQNSVFEQMTGISFHVDFLEKKSAGFDEHTTGGGGVGGSVTRQTTKCTVLVKTES